MEGSESILTWSGFFSASRNKPFPSVFPSHPTPVTQDVLYLGILTSFLVIFVSFLTIFISYKGMEEKVKIFLRVISGLILGIVIMACNYGQRWEVGEVRTGTQYKAGTGQEIHAHLGIYLGLRSVNITLKALEEPKGELKGEKIDYNERFDWTWRQGNDGFGPNAGKIQQAYRKAQEAGLPLPILWVAEYFVIDGEGIRFGRLYRYSGWFAHICVWTAFPLWILTMVLFKMVIRFAAQTLTLTGLMLLSSSLIWATRRNQTELQIPFADGILTTRYGFHWYLALGFGSLCTVLGAAIYIYDYYYPGKLYWVFGNNPLNIVEEDTSVEEGVEEVEVEVKGEETCAMPSTGALTKRKMTMQTAGRRVVTTLRVFGTTHCLKKVTHGSAGELTSSASQQSMCNMTSDEENDEGETNPIPGTPSEPPTPQPPFPSRVRKLARSQRGQCEDNLSYEDNEDEGASACLMGNCNQSEETKIQLDTA